MLAMVSYSRRPQSGHITCYLNRTYDVLLTQPRFAFAFRRRLSENVRHSGRVTEASLHLVHRPLGIDGHFIA